MYTVYWSTYFGQLWKTCTEEEVKPIMDALDKLGFQIDNVSMAE